MKYLNNKHTMLKDLVRVKIYMLKKKRMKSNKIKSKDLVIYKVNNQFIIKIIMKNLIYTQRLKDLDSIQEYIIKRIQKLI